VHHSVAVELARGVVLERAAVAAAIEFTRQGCVTEWCEGMNRGGRRQRSLDAAALAPHPRSTTQVYCTQVHSSLLARRAPLASTDK